MQTKQPEKKPLVLFASPDHHERQPEADVRYLEVAYEDAARLVGKMTDAQKAVWVQHAGKETQYDWRDSWEAIHEVLGINLCTEDRPTHLLVRAPHVSIQRAKQAEMENVEETASRRRYAASLMGQQQGDRAKEARRKKEKARRKQRAKQRRK